MYSTEAVKHALTKVSWKRSAREVVLTRAAAMESMDNLPSELNSRKRENLKTKSNVQITASKKYKEMLLLLRA